MFKDLDEDAILAKSWKLMNPNDQYANLYESLSMDRVHGKPLTVAQQRSWICFETKKGKVAQQDLRYIETKSNVSKRCIFISNV